MPDTPPVAIAEEMLRACSSWRELQGDHTARFLGNAGGFSGANIWRIATPQGEFCLKNWPKSTTRERLEYVHYLLQFVARKGFTIIPRPVSTADDQTIFEGRSGLWDLSPWLAGKADFWHHPTPARLRSALRALATFHVLAADTIKGVEFGVPQGVVSRLALLESYDPGRLAEMRRTVMSSSATDARGAAISILDDFPAGAAKITGPLAAAAKCRVPLTACLRDIWHDHVLFEGDEVVGIVDFDAVRVDCVSGDVARLIGSFVGDSAEDWASGLAAYQEVRPLSNDEQFLVQVYDHSFVVLAGLNWIQWLFESTMAFENRPGAIDRLRQIAARLYHLVHMDGAKA